jgi:hypothetical protein
LADGRLAAHARKLPAGLVGALVVLLPIECFLAAHPLEFGLPDQGEWSYSATAARAQSRHRDLLCFGDSMMKCGVYPKVLERVLGRSSYNLAVSAAPAPASYFLLRAALNHGADPRAILVDFQPALLTQGPKTVGLWGQLLSLHEIVELAWSCRDADLFARSALQRVIPSVRGRDTIRCNILAALFALPVTHREVCLARVRNWNHNLGAFAAPVNATYHGEMTQKDNEHLAPRPWNPVNIAYARRFFALAELRQIPVYLVIPPLIPAIEQSRERLGLSARYDALVQSWQAQFAMLSVIDARASRYGNSEFCDAVHLNQAGASTLSVDLADRIGERLAGGIRPGWSSLPRYRAWTKQDSTEDFRASLEIVRATGAARR